MAKSREAKEAEENPKALTSSRGEERKEEDRRREKRI